MVEKGTGPQPVVPVSEPCCGDTGCSRGLLLSLGVCQHQTGGLRFSAWLSQLWAVFLDCASWFGFDPEGSRVLHVVLSRVKSGAKGKVEGKG